MLRFRNGRRQFRNSSIRVRMALSSSGISTHSERQANSAKQKYVSRHRHFCHKLDRNQWLPLAFDFFCLEPDPLIHVVAGSDFFARHCRNACNQHWRLKCSVKLGANSPQSKRIPLFVRWLGSRYSGHLGRRLRLDFNQFFAGNYWYGRTEQA